MTKNCIYLAGCKYSSLTAARAHAKAILDNYNLGEFVNNEEEEFLKAAIALRGVEKFKEKTGSGIEYISVGYNRGGDKAFYIHRKDGSETDFSYIKCFSKSSIFSDFSTACRNAIKEDKAALKTGLGFDQYHVHHDGITFKAIVEAFIEDKQIDLTTIEYLKGDGVEGRYFKDNELAIAFNRFHSNYATLEVLPTKDHKAKHKTRVV